MAGREHLKQLFAAPEEHLSFIQSITERMQVRYTFDESIARNPYHVPIVRRKFTQDLPEIIFDIVDELESALDNAIPATNGTQLFVRLTQTGRRSVLLRKRSTL